MKERDAVPPLPRRGEPGDWFWTGGAAGKLLIGWCAPCGAWRHPSLEFCPDCLNEVTESRAVSGKGTVVAVTESHQRWLDGVDPPYVIAIVALAEDPAIRLTSNLVNCAADTAMGAPVRAVFRQVEDVWLPLFEPDSAGSAKALAELVPEPPRLARPELSRKYEDRVAITGAGASPIGRDLGRSQLSLAVEACRAAIADAGLRREDIDGLCAYPGSSGMPGVSSGGVRALEQAMRIHPHWHCGAHEVPGQLGTVIDAMLAVAAGLCRHVLCFTSFVRTGGPAVRSVDGRVAGDLAWQLSFGAASPANWIALQASHYMARYGAGREMLGHIAINARRNGALNPGALGRDPLDMESYLAARPISTPFGLLDCDMPCDGAMAFVVSAADAAADLPRPPVRVEAVGTRISEVQSWDQGTLTHQGNIFGPAAHLWSRTDLRPDDIDLALLYDGFTFNTISWIEALGFCTPGEASAFLDQGRRIAIDGSLPVNPHGGHLAAGRSNGYGHLLEAVTQLRGEGGARQVPGCRTAIVSNGGGIPASCMILRIE